VAQYDFAAATASDPAWQWLTHQRKGSAYAAQQAWPAAIAEYRLAVDISLQQNSAANVLSDNYAALGGILTRAGDTPGAIAAYQTALQYSPNTQAVRQRLAELQSGQH
jgi:predicted negative regulator of RcsB-dependent stress response